MEQELKELKETMKLVAFHLKKGLIEYKAVINKLSSTNGLFDEAMKDGEAVGLNNSIEEIYTAYQHAKKELDQ